jgi:hypothetical protein
MRRHEENVPVSSSRSPQGGRAVGIDANTYLRRVRRELNPNLTRVNVANVRYVYFGASREHADRIGWCSLESMHVAVVNIDAPHYGYSVPALRHAILASAVAEVVLLPGPARESPNVRESFSWRCGGLFMRANWTWYAPGRRRSCGHRVRHGVCGRRLGRYRAGICGSGN